MKYKICFAITSRADFSLAYPVIKEFKKIKLFKTWLLHQDIYLAINKEKKLI